MEQKEIKPGIYENIPFAEYLSWPCFHKSMVATTLRSTLHLDAYIKEDHSSTKAMVRGSLIDAMLLEPEALENDFIERPDTYPDTKTGNPKPWNNNSNHCKQFNEDAKIQNLMVYSTSDFIKSGIMARNIQEHETASKWINGGRNQLAIVWIDEETGIPCKARLDVLQSDMIIDLKSTVNASPGEFRRTLNNFGYHTQAAIYTEGWAALNQGELLPWGFVVVESEAPFAVATYTLGEESLLTGRSLFRRAIRRYKDYLENGPDGYSKLSEEIEIPGWAINQEDEINEQSLLGDIS